MLLSGVQIHFEVLALLKFIEAFRGLFACGGSIPELLLVAVVAWFFGDEILLKMFVLFRLVAGEKRPPTGPS